MRQYYPPPKQEHVLKNFVRLKRRERDLGKWRWGDVVKGVDVTDPVNKKLFHEFNCLSPTQQAAYQFSALGLSSVGDVAIDLPDANVLLQVTAHAAPTTRRLAKALGTP